MATSPLSATFQARQTRLDSLCPGGVRDEQSSSAGAILFENNGLCACGCKQKTSVHNLTDRCNNQVAGVPMRFIHGHNLVGKPFDHYVMEEPNTGCSLWMGFASKDGYGQTSVDRKTARAHRVAWEQENGKIPSGMVIDHICRTRSCVNTKHMEIVSNKENVLRGIGISAMNAKKKTCPKCGSEYTYRTWSIGRVGRYCLSCANYSQNKRRSEKGGIS